MIDRKQREANYQCVLESIKFLEKYKKSKTKQPVALKTINSVLADMKKTRDNIFRKIQELPSEGILR